jgi:hypothetical protein
MLHPIMVPRLRPPLVYGSEEASPFSRGPHERQLRVAVDDAEPGLGPDADVLFGLRTHELINMTTTSEVGPSVVSVDRESLRDDHIPVWIRQPDGSESLRSVWPASTWLRFADEFAGRSGRDPSVEQRRFLLAGALSGVVDALVLPDPDLGTGSLTRDANAMSTAQATALVGLFLRSRGADEEEFGERWASRVAIGTQRFIVTRCLLEAGWRWWSACLAAGEETLAIAQGAQLRFERALRARDEVMIECLHDARGRAIDRDVLYHFDAMLLWLGGAIDTTALIAGRALGLGVPDHLVGWRRQQWRDALASADQQLHAMTAVGTPLRAVIDLIAIFRNTIHGEPITGVTYSSAGDERGLVQLPVNAEVAAVTACNQLGGRDLWGFVREGVGSIGGLWDPFQLVQVLLPFSASALNVLMNATEVERFPDVDPKALMRTRPNTDFFEPARVRRLLALHGVADAAIGVAGNGR